MKDKLQTDETAKNEDTRKPFEQPKLAYIKPKLNKQGKVTQVTQSFFGSFSP